MTSPSGNPRAFSCNESGESTQQDWEEEPVKRAVHRSARGLFCPHPLNGFFLLRRDLDVSHGTGVGRVTRCPPGTSTSTSRNRLRIGFVQHLNEILLVGSDLLQWHSDS